MAKTLQEILAGNKLAEAKKKLSDIFKPVTAPLAQGEKIVGSTVEPIIKSVTEAKPTAQAEPTTFVDKANKYIQESPILSTLATPLP